MERRQVRYMGSVQGVGFRATAAALARGFRVTGWVRNEPDGSVLLEAQGVDVEVERYLAAIRRRMERSIADARELAVVPDHAEEAFEIRR